MAAYDHEWNYEDDSAYQLACEQPDPRDGFEADDEDAYWARQQEGFEEDDGQPDEYTEWQDFMGGDEYYDHSEQCGYDD